MNTRTRAFTACCHTAAVTPGFIPGIHRRGCSGQFLDCIPGTRGKDGKLNPEMGGKWRILAKIFANPDLPEIDDFNEPFTFDDEHLHTGGESRANLFGGRVKPSIRRPGSREAG